MRWKPMLVTAIALAALSALAARWTRPSRDHTTASRQAWELYRRGDEDFLAFRWQDAETALREASRRDPGFAMARAALSQVEASLGRDSARAVAAAAESLALRLPDGPERWTVQLRLADADERFLARRDSLMTLLAAKRPDDVWVARTRARLAADRLDLPAEEAAWQAVLRLNQNTAEAYNELAYLAARRGRYEEARSYAKKYAFLAPKLANPHDSLGEILTFTGAYEDAEREFKQALHIQPDFFPSLLNLAQLFIERGELHKGLTLCEQVRAQIGGTAWEKRVDSQLIQTYFDNGLRQPLREAIERMIAHDPTDDRAPYYRALALALAGRDAEGQATCDSFIATSRRSPYYRVSESYRQSVEMQRHRYRAIVARLRGDFRTAAEEFGLALQVASTSTPPHARWPLQLRYGEALERQRRHAEALAQARDILAVNPRRLGALVLAVRAQAGLGQTAAAREALDRLRAALARADRDLPAVAAADSLSAALARISRASHLREEERP